MLVAKKLVSAGLYVFKPIRSVAIDGESALAATVIAGGEKSLETSVPDCGALTLGLEAAEDKVVMVAGVALPPMIGAAERFGCASAVFCKRAAVDVGVWLEIFVLSVFAIFTASGRGNVVCVAAAMVARVCTICSALPTARISLARRCASSADKGVKRKISPSLMVRAAGGSVWRMSGLSWVCVLRLRDISGESGRVIFLFVVMAGVSLAIRSPRAVWLVSCLLWGVVT